MKQYDYIDKEIWCLYWCDEWKTTSTMNLALVTTDTERLRDFIREQIKHGNMEYDGETIKEMLDNFDEDWETTNIADVNGKLVYGFYHSTCDGEEV